MPDPYERFGRPGKYDYDDSQPSRSAARDAAAQEHLQPEIIPEGKRPPGKKNPDLCKGQHWKGPHTPEAVVNVNGWHSKNECGWGVSWIWGNCEPVWYCRHVLICSGCGKDLGKPSVEECPLYHEITPEEQTLLDEKIRESEERHLAWQQRRKPVIQGPQGYRKKR
jgi:hypothetical protein